MIFKILKLTSLALIIVLAMNACASKHYPHKKLKHGKPIPCPLKDC